MSTMRGIGARMQMSPCLFPHQNSAVLRVPMQRVEAELGYTYLTMPLFVWHDYVSVQRHVSS